MSVHETRESSFHRQRYASVDPKARFLSPKPIKNLPPLKRTQLNPKQISGLKRFISQDNTPQAQERQDRFRTKIISSRVIRETQQIKNELRRLSNRTQEFILASDNSVNITNSKRNPTEDAYAFGSSSELYINKSELARNGKLQSFLPLRQWHGKNTPYQLFSSENESPPKITAFKGKNLELENLRHDYFNGSVLNEYKSPKNLASIRVKSLTTDNSPEKGFSYKNFKESTTLQKGSSVQRNLVTVGEDEIEWNNNKQKEGIDFEIGGSIRIEEPLGTSMIESCVRALDYCNINVMDVISRKPKTKTNGIILNKIKMRDWSKPKRAKLKLVPVYDCKLTNLKTFDSFNGTESASPRLSIFPSVILDNSKASDNVVISHFPSIHKPTRLRTRVLEE